jgi:hypothetical protein
MPASSAMSLVLAAAYPFRINIFLAASFILASVDMVSFGLMSAGFPTQN